MKRLTVLIVTVLSGCAVAQNDPMWAPSGPDIIAALNKHYVREAGPLSGSTARELSDPTTVGRYTIQAKPPTPTPERAYEWIPVWAYDVVVVVFKTPDDALQCLKNSYAGLKPRYDGAPAYRPWPNFQTYVSHSFNMTQFHKHEAYRGATTVKMLRHKAYPMQPDPVRDKMLTEQQFISDGYEVYEGTGYDAAWVRGRTLMACCPADDPTEIDRFHNLMHALTSVKKPVPPPVPPPGPKPPVQPPPRHGPSQATRGWPHHPAPAAASALAGVPRLHRWPAHENTGSANRTQRASSRRARRYLPRTRRECRLGGLPTQDHRDSRLARRAALDRPQDRTR